MSPLPGSTLAARHLILPCTSEDLGSPADCPTGFFCAAPHNPWACPAARLKGVLLARAEHPGLELVHPLAGLLRLRSPWPDEEPLNAHERKHLLEVLEDRCGNSSTLFTSQLEPKHRLRPEQVSAFARNE